MGGRPAHTAHTRPAPALPLPPPAVSPPPHPEEQSQPPMPGCTWLPGLSWAVAWGVTAGDIDVDALPFPALATTFSSTASFSSRRLSTWGRRAGLRHYIQGDHAIHARQVCPPPRGQQGVDRPNASCWSTSSPPEAEDRRAWTTSRWPHWLAKCSGECPFVFCTATLAPADSRARTTPTWPVMLAPCRGEAPLYFLWFALAPAASRASATSRWPFMQAANRGV